MSHTIPANSITTTPFTFTVVNYATGGEVVSPLEFGGPALVNGVCFAEVPPGQNSLGITLFPLLIAGKIQLRQFSAGNFTEIAPTVNLNAVLVGFIFG